MNKEYNIWKKIKKILKEIPLLFWLLCLIVVSGLMVYILFFEASKFGKNIGGFYGKLVGTAVGSSTGFLEGLDEGKKEGLSAVDTITEIENSFHEIAKLEVLVSSFKLNDYHELGNKYAALYLLKADAVFIVDLSRVSVEAKEDSSVVYIRVPQPEVTVYIDDRYTERAIESQRKFFNGSAEDGFNAYINSMSNLEINAQNSIVNDENLMRSARSSAEKQIKWLTKSVFLNGEEPLIVWE